MIKVIKQKELADIARVRTPPNRPRVRPMTVTTTVNDWISESRRNKLADDISARATIAGWTAEAHT